ncbi:ABC transporter ATP-binding protein [Desulfobacter vibrioformis]|uniref:ABC transporter ATP-binding protein n=1 Tax=Desulfobacter vibrioformis TaxID=34031 RepID=UPI00068F9656|nr:ABC transporter ATP-binding protein [Desulfobacter vibrioformis]
MIQLKNLSKIYARGKAAVTVLSDVSFSVKNGNLALILGKSGSGKTTLLNCIGGLDLPQKGSVNCFGIRVDKLSGRKRNNFRRKQLGFVFQSGNLITSLSARRNIEFPLILNKYASAQIQDRVAFLLNRLDLEDVADAMPSSLSRGQAQRVAFARGVAHGPGLLLADEPTASLDTRTGLELIRLMHALSKEEKITMIVATHDKEIIPFADLILHLSDGRIKGENE